MDRFRAGNHFCFLHDLLRKIALFAVLHVNCLRYDVAFVCVFDVSSSKAFVDLRKKFAVLLVSTLCLYADMG